MARRARKGVSGIQIAAIALVFIAVGGIVLFMLSRSKDSMRSVSELNVADYVNKGDSMGGTVWKLTGQIDEKLKWTADRGQFVSILIEEASVSLPVLVPPEFNDQNINIGDRFTIKVEVAEKQLLIARELIRS